MKRIVILAIFFTIGTAASAQISRFLEKGQSGVGLRLGIEKTYGNTGYSAQLGGSIKGIVDIEASFTRDAYDAGRNNLTKGNANSNLYEGWVNWWVLRKQIIPAIDVNLAIWGEYAYSAYSNYTEAETDTTSYDYNSFMEGQLGFEISLNFRATNTWWIQPGCFAYYAVGRQKWEDKAGQVKDNYQGIGSSISLAVIKRIKKSSLYIMANQYFDSYQASTNKYKVSIGYVFGL